MNKLKIIFSKKFFTVYASDPAAEPGRMESIYNVLKDEFEFVEPEPLPEKFLEFVHTKELIASVKKDEVLYEVAVLAAGGTVKASTMALNGETVFALVRPPGHHASANYNWGFCFFNNIAVSIEKLRRENKIKNALIVDFDLHFGDGTDSIFKQVPEVKYFHVPDKDREETIRKLTRFLEEMRKVDIVAVSAGFDRHEKDWGGVLKTEDYKVIGELIKEFSESKGKGRRYAALEGGYNKSVLGKNVKAFLEGFK